MNLCNNTPVIFALSKLDSFLPPYTGTQPFDLALAVADWEDLAHREDVGHQEDVVLRQEDAIIYSLWLFPGNLTPFHT